jgi:hypothetical protein
MSATSQRSWAVKCKRRHAAGAPLHESLFVLAVVQAIQRRLIGARDLIIDSAPILAWRRCDPDATFGHAPAHHPRPLLLGYRVHSSKKSSVLLIACFLGSATSVEARGSPTNPTGWRVGLRPTQSSASITRVA